MLGFRGVAVPGRTPLERADNLLPYIAHDQLAHLVTSDSDDSRWVHRLGNVATAPGPAHPAASSATATKAAVRRANVLTGSTTARHGGFTTPSGARPPQAL